MLSFSGCSNAQLLSEKQVCKTDKVESLKLETINEDLLGDWDYEYSYYDDTCFVLDTLGDLSFHYQFKKKNKEEIKKESPKIYSFGEGKYLFGLISYHDSKPFGNMSYPISIMEKTYKSQTYIKVCHYTGYGSVLNKGYNYTIKSVYLDTLVLINERYYNINGLNKSGINHVYLKRHE